ncbi:hypothetical protein OH492_06850 [Vibrio chagasii]|nr:hypothetical protein [Vibrio chagasii]
MCSWCWGYKPTLELLKQQLPASIEFNYVVPLVWLRTLTSSLSEEMKSKLQAIWKQIEAKLGTESSIMNFGLSVNLFAALTLRVALLLLRVFQDHYEQMLEAIQHAYYLRAMLPHSEETHKQIG